MASDQNLPPNEVQWLIQIRRILDHEIDIGEDEAISICDVPKPLMYVKPETYMPQLVALGPYHHYREELRNMERYKLSAAKRVQSQLPSMNFQLMVDVFMSQEHRIRAHYQRYLNHSTEKLAWIMAIDVSFLLQFLQVFTKNGQRIGHLVGSSHSMLLRDALMLENQLPLFLLFKAAEMQCVSPQTAQALLLSSLHGLLDEVSLFHMPKETSNDIAQHPHLLDFMYSNMVLHPEEELGASREEERTIASSAASLCIDRCIAFASVIIQFMVRIPFRLITSTPAFLVMKLSMERLFLGQAQTDGASENNSTPPLLQEIAVPSVTELAYAGLALRPAAGGLSAIELCLRAGMLRLPVVRLDVNSEVLLRNLVAYEASIGSRPLVLARYVELMNGIIDTEEDARLLRESGIVVNHLRSDGEVAELWNGMTRSLRLTRVAKLDAIIDGLNKYYSSSWKVKVRRFMRTHLLGSKDGIACILMVMFFLFMMMQSFFAALIASRRVV